MSRRIDIELTSALGDGTWTWRAAGARQPKGVLDGSILPDGAKVGDELKVEIEQEIDGITVLNVVHGREKQDRADLIELLPSERDFQPVVETRAKRERGERRGREGDRRPRRGDRDQRRGDERGGRGDQDRDQRRGRDGGRGRRGPSFTPPPEVPQRPKPKRLRPGKQHRSAVLAELPEEQRPIAELALQGMGAVRQRLREENEKAAAEGRAPMPEATVMKMAEELLPKLRVAEWRDRAEAAQRQLQHLDLRDLRSVVAAAGDPMVARDESTSALAEDLQAALVRKQDEELQLWFGDVDAALAVGRVIRALRLSSQPPKAGVPFPADIAQRLVDSANASLAPMDSPDRWVAMLEAAAFSPVRSLVEPARKPDVVNDELLATVKRLAPALPRVAALFEIEVDPSAPMPKPLRPGPRGGRKAKDGGKQQSRGDRPGRQRDERKSERRDRRRPPASDTAAAEPATSAAQAAETKAAPAPEPTTPDTAGAPAPDTAASATEPTPDTASANEPATEATPDTAGAPAPDTAASATEPASSTPEPAATEPAAEATTEPAATEPAVEATPEPAAGPATAPAAPPAETGPATATADDPRPATEA